MMGSMDPGAQHYKWNGSSWTKDKDLPEVGGRSSVVVYNGEMHLIGGYNNRTNTILRQHYKFNGSSWTSVSKLPYDFWYGAAVVYEGCIHILGSYYSLNPKKHYKFNGSAWINEGDLPEYADRSACVVYRNSIYIVGSNWNTSYRTSAARITAPIKTYSPNTIIIQRGSGTTGVYFTAIADLSVISGGNRFPIGFDDIYYFDKTAFDWDAEIYYGNGTNWIKFKN